MYQPQRIPKISLSLTTPTEFSEYLKLLLCLGQSLTKQCLCYHPKPIPEKAGLSYEKGNNFLSTKQVYATGCKSAQGKKNDRLECDFQKSLIF